MTSTTKITLVIAVAILSVVGGYFAFVPDSEESARPDDPLISPSRQSRETVRPSGEQAASGADQQTPPVRIPADSPFFTDGKSGGILSEAAEGILGRPEEDDRNIEVIDWTGSSPTASETARREQSPLPAGAWEIRTPVANPSGGNNSRTDAGVGSAPSAPLYGTYIVQSGDTMTGIALEHFGDSARWDLIAQANPLVDPNRLRIGQRLNLPSRDTTRQPASHTAELGPVYVVQSGDSLSTISWRYFNTGRRWQAIYEANRGVIGPDPDHLRVGTRLLIPDAPNPP